MKKLFTFCFIFVFLSASSFAQVLLQENFSYQESDSLTSHGWVAHSGGTTNAFIVSPGISYARYSASGTGGSASFKGSGQDVNKSLSDTAVASGSLYASFMVNFSSASSTGDYFFHFMQSPSNTFTFLGRVYVKMAANGNLSFGLSKSSTSAGIPAVYSDSIYTAGESHLLVLKYTFGPDTLDDAVSLFVDPVISSEEPAAATLTHSTAAAADPAYLGAIAIRQGSGSPVGFIDGISVASSWSGVVGYPLLSLTDARADLDSDFVPDMLGDTVVVRGVVLSPNFQTSNRSYFIWDGTAGINTFKTGLLGPALQLSDSIQITGFLRQFNGVTEIDPLSDSATVILGTGATLPEPVILTIEQFLANPESYEGTLVGFANLVKVSGTWPASGSSATLRYSDGSDSIDIRIDSDADIDGNPEPTGLVDIIGIGAQFDNSAPYNSGYQIFPRYFATDFLPGGTVPVELTSFTASYAGSAVKLQWSTATEKNNSGFEVQRRSDRGAFETVAFVRGSGTTSEKRSYSYSDADVRNGVYTYRLKQVDLDGSYEYSNEVNVNVNIPQQYSLEQNYPNPFNPTTSIRFTLAADSKVTLQLFNILGQEIATLLNGSFAAGPQVYNLNASNLNSGVYFYKITANGVDGSAYSAVKKMMLAK